MILYMYTDVLINQLRDQIKTNKDLYKQKNKFIRDIISEYETQLYPLEIDVEYPQLNKTISKRGDDKLQWEIDCENSIKLHSEFIGKYNIPVSIFSDERFILFLTHDIYYDYMICRWPIENENESRIKEKYFLPTGSQAFTRNSFLRLFWYSYITYDKDSSDPYHLTKIAFEYADPVNQIMERKYSKNEKIVKAALTAIKNSQNAKILNSKRTLYGKAINNILSMYCLDVLNDSELINLFEGEIVKITKAEFQDDEIE